MRKNKQPKKMKKTRARPLFFFSLYTTLIPPPTREHFRSGNKKGREDFRSVVTLYELSVIKRLKELL